MNPQRLTDDQLRVLVCNTIRSGGSYTALQYQLTAARISAGTKRLRRLWVDEGGKVRPKRRLYAPGTGPMDL